MDIKLHMLQKLRRSIFAISFLCSLLAVNPTYADTANKIDSEGKVEVDHFAQLESYLVSHSYCSASLPGVENLFPPQLAPPVINGVASTNPTDCNVDDGTITIDASSTDPMEYSINFGVDWSPDNVFTGVPAGNYTILVRNIGETTDVAYMNNPVQLVAPTPPMLLAVSPTVPTDCTTSDGQIIIVASPGSTAASLYSIDGGQNWQASNTFFNVANGVYVALVSNDDGSCVQANPGNPIELYSADAPTILSVNSTPATDCNIGDGTITVVGSGAGALEYSIDGGTNWRAVNSFDDLVTGNYDVMIRNVGGSCEVSYALNPVAVGGPTEPILTEVLALNISDCGADDGSINIAANPGMGTVEYSIDGGFLYLPDSSFNNLLPGTYAVKIRYVGGTCEVTYANNPIVINDPNDPAITSIDSLDPSGCTNTDGQITINATGERELFYSVDGGTNFQTDNVFSNLAAGTYDVVVAYAGQACVATSNTITLANDPLAAVLVSADSLTACFNVAGVYPLTGDFITVDGMPLAAGHNLTYSSTEGSFDDPTDPNTNFTLNTNQTGSVSINVLLSDANTGCVDDTTFVLSVFETPVFSLSPAITCAGGPISLFTGTTGQHEWSVISGDVTSLSCTDCPSPIATPSTSTLYQVEVFNAFTNACSAVDSMLVTVLPSPEVLNHMDVLSLCTGDTLPVTIELSENITSYSISTFSQLSDEVLNGNILTFNAIMPGSSANYSIEMTGVNGCSINEAILVQRVSAPTASFNFNPPTCAQSDVALSFTGTASQGANLTWDLDGGTTVYSSPQMGTNPAGNELTANWPGVGTYEVKLTVDDGGCVDHDTMDVVITHVAPQISYTATTASSCGLNLATIDLTVTGMNNSFLWEGANGFTANSEDLSNLEAGIYGVTVTNTVTLCSNSETITIDEDGFFNCTDYVRILIPAEDPYNVCLDDVVNLPNAILTANVCDDDPATVTVSVNQTDDCIVLDPNDSFIGEDTVCVVHCDGSTPIVCDTTYLVVMVSPPTDTIMVNVLADIRSEICIPAGVLQIGGAITSAAFCNTGDAATVEGVSIEEECVTVQAAPGFTGMASDLICVVHCYDNFALFCDTTYIEITVDPNNCVDYIIEENLTVPLADCNVPATVCIGIPFSNIANYQVKDNGSDYTGGFVACGTDSTAFTLDQGVHVLSFIDQTTACPDTVIVDVDNGLDIYAGPIDFEVSCDSVLEFCLNIPFGDLATYQMTDNGNPLSTGGCGLDSIYSYDYSNIPGQGGTGPYLLQNWTVNGSVFIGSFNTIDELVDSMNVWNPTGMWQHDFPNLSIVGGDFSSTYSPTMAVAQVIGGNGTIDLGVNYMPTSVMIQLDTGYHQLVFTHIPSNCFEAIDINIHCITDFDCESILADEVLVLNADDCNTDALYCIDINPSDFADYNVFDNGAAYAGTFEGCNNDEFTTYSFIPVPGQGNTGPYELISWTVGLDVFTGFTFMDLSELLAQMAIWDPAGTWNLNATTISGGEANKSYGAIQISYNGGIYPVYPTPFIVSNGTSVALDTGFHQLVLEHVPTGCLDTVDITVNCLECTDFIADENIFLPLSDCNANASYCTELPFTSLGDYSITDNGMTFMNTESCPGTGGLAIALSLDVGAHAIVFTEIATGCTDEINITVTCTMSSTQVVELVVNTRDTLCVDDTDLLGNVISNTNICEDASGEYAVFAGINGTFCYTVDGIELGQDTACIVLCDDLGACDTTYLIVNIVDEFDPVNLPVASSDVASTYEGQPVSVDVLSNDLINGVLDTFYIIDQPENGFAWYDTSGMIHFQPDPEFCDFANPEMISYAICNEFACDSSELLVTVLCDEIKPFSGFSPNGDGINDNFVIQGAELHSESQLFIFSRWGTLIFKVTGYQNDWDGTWEGNPLPEGTYFYLYDTGNGEKRNGYLQIQR